MTSIVISDELASRVREVAEQEGQEVLAFVEEAIQTALRRARDRLVIAQTKSWYRLPLEERQKYSGLYVAFYQGEVIDTDPDRRTLYLRVRKERGSLPVAIIKGGDMRRPEFRLPTPRIVRMAS